MLMRSYPNYLDYRLIWEIIVDFEIQHREFRNAGTFLKPRLVFT
jgi:hypothetical protein